MEKEKKVEVLRTVFRNVRSDARFGVHTQKDFAKAIGVQPSSLSSAMNGDERYLTNSLLERVYSAFPELLGNNTNMVVTGDVIGNGNNVIAGNNNKVSEVIEPEYIEELREAAKAEIEEELSIPIVSGDISTASGVDVQTYIKKNEDELESINPAKMVAHADHAELMSDMAMAPTFLPGDYIFLRFLKDKNAITDGKRYYFNSLHRASMIRKVKIEGENLRLIAENPSFGDIVLPKSDVIRVAKIVGMMRLTFGDYYADIEAVRQQKDEQIMKIIDHQGKLIEEMGEFSRRENILMQLLANKQ